MSRLSRIQRERAEAEQRANSAWGAYAALVRAEQRDADLHTNEFWQALKDTAHARFRAIYESEAMR